MGFVLKAGVIRAVYVKVLHSNSSVSLAVAAFLFMHGTYQFLTAFKGMGLLCASGTKL